MEEADRREFIESALDERDRWQGVLRNEPDQYGTLEDLVFVYKEAILNREQTVAETLKKMWVESADED